MPFFFSKSKGDKIIKQRTNVLLSEPCKCEKIADSKKLAPISDVSDKEMIQNIQDSFSHLLTEPNTKISISHRGILKSDKSIQPSQGAKRHISFNRTVTITETYSSIEYSRKGEYISKAFTPETAYFIKNELNQFKEEMEVHQDSRKYTQLYQI